MDAIVGLTGESPEPEPTERRVELRFRWTVLTAHRDTGYFDVRFRSGSFFSSGTDSSFL
jgi:hypothetical protein